MKTRSINSDFAENFMAMLALLGILFCLQSGLLKNSAERLTTLSESIWCTAHLNDAAGHEHTELPLTSEQQQFSLAQSPFSGQLSPLPAASNYLLVLLPDLRLLYVLPRQAEVVLLPDSRHILFRCLRI